MTGRNGNVTVVANRRFDERKYGRLLARALPKSIESQHEYNRVLGQVQTLMSKGEEHLSPEEDILLDLLAALVERYEDEHYPIPEASGAEVLKHLMEARGMRQADLVSVIGSRGYVSDLVNGRREIGKKVARKLAGFFHVPSDVFL
jgi:HTH-type transcriptional regulator/antitoxin HigA